jgi:release factor glutamine methyltransferase
MAYLLGRREFWSLEFLVDERVLIPRPETELLVETALELVAAAPSGALVDLGTGSGAVAVALARECAAREVVAVDLSAAALEVAAFNVARLAPGRVRLLRGDWLAAFAPDAVALVVSNPPYVEDGYGGLASAALGHEPRAALAAGTDGLDALRVLVPQARRCLRCGGWLVVEHGAGQGAAVRELFGAAGFVAVATRRDLAGHERATAGRRP